MTKSNHYNSLYEIGKRYGYIDITATYPAILGGQFEAFYYDITVRVYDEGWPGDDPYALRLHLMHRANALVKEIRDNGWHLMYGVGIDFDGVVTLPICTVTEEVIEPEKEQMISCAVHMTIQRIGD